MTRLLQNDATLVAAQAEARSLLIADADERDELKKDAIMTRWGEVARLIQRTRADTHEGLAAKALSLLDEIELSDEEFPSIDALAVESLCNDLIRLCGGDDLPRGNVVPLRPAPSGGDAA